mmetsp:Transcript_35954/g.89632  ORF Transcript_35954/g.89632 Transcript_35954/m.89632 type:complete len:145 (-) Transcript_35954:418-852(-)
MPTIQTYTHTHRDGQAYTITRTKVKSPRRPVPPPPVPPPPSRIVHIVSQSSHPHTESKHPGVSPGTQAYRQIDPLDRLDRLIRSSYAMLSTQTPPIHTHHTTPHQQQQYPSIPCTPIGQSGHLSAIHPIDRQTGDEMREGGERG